MLDQFESFFMTEQDYLRLEAMDLFERCLTEGKPDDLMRFIETQIASEPPHLDLLHQIAEDLRQRLLGLQEYQLDVCDRISRTLRTNFEANISHPLNVQTSSWDVDTLLRQVALQRPHFSRRERVLLRKILEGPLAIHTQLRNDIKMTEHLLACLMDWLDALDAAESRRCWTASLLRVTADRIH